MKYLAFAFVGLCWLVGSVPEANAAVVACGAGYYYHGGRCVVVVRRPVVAPVARCYWRAGVRVCR